MSTNKKQRAFEEAKRQCLSRTDLSRKGSIDEPIRPLVELFNLSTKFYTTSTCSGRISLISKPSDNAAIKKGGDFLLNSHDFINFDNFKQILTEFLNRIDNECLWLKFEPFIMHIQCLNLEAAHSLSTIALAAGCRNSGITMGKNEKYLVAIRSTSSMEVPLHCGKEFDILKDDYIQFLCNQCNLRMKDNFARLIKFQEHVKELIEDKT